MAAGLQKHDPDTDYEVDVFLGPRQESGEQNMAVNFVRHAIELSNMSDTEFGARFASEIARAIRGLPNSSKAAEELVNMHIRHGQLVRQVLEGLISQHCAKILDGTLEPSSLLALVVGQKHLESSWQSYASRIAGAGILVTGLPIACKSQQPRDEPHLQELCDGILVGSGEKLPREFPFLRWASVLTKPDWSNEDLCLWIEAKYVRSSSKPSRITDELAADITKYSAVGRRALFIVYDPERLTKADEIQKAIESYPNMMVRFIT